MCHRGLVPHLKTIFHSHRNIHSTYNKTSVVLCIYAHSYSPSLSLFTPVHACPLSQHMIKKKTLSPSPLPITIDTMCDNARASKVIVIFMAAVDTTNVRIIDVKLIVITASATDGAWWNYIGKPFCFFRSVWNVSVCMWIKYALAKVRIAFTMQKNAVGMAILLALKINNSYRILRTSYVYGCVRYSQINMSRNSWQHKPIYSFCSWEESRARKGS